MAEAMIQGLISRNLVGPREITVSEPRQKRREELQQRHGVNVTAKNREAAQSCKIIVLSVKPQDLVRVLPELKGSLQPESMIISIVAGARVGTISKWLEHDAIVRVMPNTPAQISEGISVWTGTPAVTDSQLSQARTILQALGKEIFVDDEKFLDMATAVSGTGPSYVFLVAEAMIDAAVHLGFPRHIAYELVTETLRGSGIRALVAWWSSTDPPPGRPTSPGGLRCRSQSGA